MNKMQLLACCFSLLLMTIFVDAKPPRETETPRQIKSVDESKRVPVSQRINPLEVGQIKSDIVTEEKDKGASKINKIHVFTVSYVRPTGEKVEGTSRPFDDVLQSKTAEDRKLIEDAYWKQNMKEKLTGQETKKVKELEKEMIAKQDETRDAIKKMRFVDLIKNLYEVSENDPAIKAGLLKLGVKEEDFGIGKVPDFTAKKANQVDTLFVRVQCSKLYDDLLQSPNIRIVGLLDPKLKYSSDDSDSSVSTKIKQLSEIRAKELAVADYDTVYATLKDSASSQVVRARLDKYAAPADLDVASLSSAEIGVLTAKLKQLQELEAQNKKPATRRSASVPPTPTTEKAPELDRPQSAPIPEAV